MLSAMPPSTTTPTTSICRRRCQSTDAPAAGGRPENTSDTPMSGYDLTTAVHRSVAQFWPISKSQIYKELPRLEADGLIAGTDVSQDLLPDKRVYETTDAGLAEFDRWLADGELPPMLSRMPELLKLFFGDRMGDRAIRSMLVARRASETTAIARFEDVLAHLDAVPAARYVRATARYGLLAARAYVEWVDETLADLDRKLSASTPDVDLLEFIRAVPPRPAP